MRELVTINYIQNEVTKQNEAIINLQSHTHTHTHIYIYNPNLRDVRIMGIGHLRKNNTQLIKH